MEFINCIRRGIKLYAPAGKPVLEAADRKAIQLIVGIPVDIRMIVIQIPSPCISVALQGRPDVRVVAQIVVTAVGIAVAGGQNPDAKIIA